MDLRFDSLTRKWGEHGRKDILVIIIYNANYLYWETPTIPKPKRKKLRERNDDSYWLDSFMPCKVRTMLNI
jgi:hypothetical protein